MDIDELKNHARQLRKEQGITRIYSIPPEAKPWFGDGFAVPHAKAVYHMSIDSELRYLIALHEIGHIAALQGAPMLCEEATAWRWALEHAKVDEDYALSVATTFLRGYFQNCRSVFVSSKSKKAVPYKNHYFWELINATETVDRESVKLIQKGTPTFKMLDYWKPIDREHLIKTKGRFVAPPQPKPVSEHAQVLSND